MKNKLDEELIAQGKAIGVAQRNLDKLHKGLQVLEEQRAERDYGVKRGTVVMSTKMKQLFKVTSVDAIDPMEKPWLDGMLRAGDGTWADKIIPFGPFWELEKKDDKG